MKIQSIQKLFNRYTFQQSENKITEEIKIDQEEFFIRQQDSQQGHKTTYKIFQIINQSKPNLAFLMSALSLLFALHAIRKENRQSVEIAQLRNKIDKYENHNYLKHENSLAAHIENKFIPGLVEIVSNTTLEVDALDKLIVFKASNSHIKLPPLNSLLTGVTFKFFGIFPPENPCFIEVMEDSKDILQFGNKHEKRSIPINSGQYLELFADTKNNFWYPINRNIGLELTSDFAGGFSKDTGWQKLPGGLLMQWGHAVSNKQGMIDIIFPVAFNDKDSITIQATHLGAGPVFTLQLMIPPSTTGAKLRVYNTVAQADAGWHARWLAIGH